MLPRVSDEKERVRLRASAVWLVCVAEGTRPSRAKSPLTCCVLRAETTATLSFPFLFDSLLQLLRLTGTCQILLGRGEILLQRVLVADTTRDKFTDAAG